jgi:hypothetical protein
MQLGSGPVKSKVVTQIKILKIVKALEFAMVVLVLFCELNNILNNQIDDDGDDVNDL